VDELNKLLKKHGLQQVRLAKREMPAEALMNQGYKSFLGNRAVDPDRRMAMLVYKVADEDKVAKFTGTQEFTRLLKGYLARNNHPTDFHSTGFRNENMLHLGKSVHFVIEHRVQD
jgi:hypothetical protein